MSREITPTQIAKAISDLLEENEKLKERIEYLERSNNRREESIIYLREESIDFETRIDKAINYIEILIQTINEQPSRNVEEDNYILDRLEGFIEILKGEKE